MDNDLFIELFLIVIAFAYCGFAGFRVEVGERVRWYRGMNMYVGANFGAGMDGGRLVGPDRDDAVASEEDVIPYDKCSLSFPVIVGAPASSSEIHVLAGCRARDAGSGMLGFIVSAESGLFHLASDDTS